MNKMILIVVPILLVLASCTQPKSPQSLHISLTQQQILAVNNHTWVNQAWTGNDLPYQAIRSKIDQQIAEGQNPDTLRIQYGLAAQKQPRNPVAQFAWAYAAWKTINSKYSHNVAIDTAGIPEALAQVPFPKTYNFARIRFLIDFAGGDFISLGERLLKIDPQDNDVKNKLVACYEGMLFDTTDHKRISSKIRLRALQLANQLVASNPKKVEYRAALAYTYVYSWYRYKDQSDGQNAIAACQKLLTLAPPNDGRRQSAKQFILMIQQKS